MFNSLFWQAVKERGAPENEATVMTDVIKATRRPDGHAGPSDTKSFAAKFFITNVVLINTLSFFAFIVGAVTDPISLASSVLKSTNLQATVNDLCIALVRTHCVSYIAIVTLGLRALWSDHRGRYEFLFLLVAFHVGNTALLCIPSSNLAKEVLVNDAEELESTGDFSQDVEENFDEHNFLVLRDAI